MVHEVSVDFGGRPLTVTTGRIALESDASVTVQYGDTILLATANVTDKPVDANFMPLRVDFEEKMYSVGRIPGGFFKREGRPSEDAILTSRKIDRPIRPLLEAGMRNDMQVIVLPLSVDDESSVDVVAMIAGSAAMHLSSIPFAGPFGAVRVAQIDGEFVINPGFEELKEATLDLLVAATREGIVQIEMDADRVDDAAAVEAMEIAYDACMLVVDLLDELRAVAGKPKGDFTLWAPRAEIAELIEQDFKARIHETLEIKDRNARDAALDALKDEAGAEALSRGFEGPGADVHEIFESIVKERLQELAFDENARVDGRDLDEIRPISCEVGFLPRTHGSALFTRGETQVLTTTTFGAYRDQKLVRTLQEEEYSRFTHHYNFPPFSTGEVRGLRGTGRREIGHGMIGEKALARVLPAEDDFPYTIRLVSEVLGANASTSMAATCGCSLALMDAGVPIDEHIAGAGIGLIRRGDDYRLLTDMQGVEDFMGYMDFKVAGSADGITCIQMDTKTHGLPITILAEALGKARSARQHILTFMNEAISTPRAELSAYAPRMVQVTIPTDKIGLIIGPGGKNIRAMQTDYEVSIDIDDEGSVRIFGEDGEKVAQVCEIINDMTREIEAGEVIKGKVVSITDFGAFVEIVPGRDGLLHISDIDWSHVNKVDDVLKVGDEVEVKVVSVEADGKVRLSRKVLLERPADGGDDSKGGGSRRGGRRDSGSSRRGDSRKGGRGGSEGSSRGTAYYRDKKN